MNVGSMILAGMTVAALGAGGWALLSAPKSEAPAMAAVPPPVILKERRTVSWFVANPEVMSATLAACRDDPAHARIDADCLNARQAATERYAAETMKKAMAGLGESK